MEKFTKNSEFISQWCKKNKLVSFFEWKDMKTKENSCLWREQILKCFRHLIWWICRRATEVKRWSLEVFSENALLNCVWLQPQTVEECVWGEIPCVRQDDAEHEVIVEHLTTLQNEAWRHLLRSSKACVTKRQLVWKITLCFSVLTCEIKVINHSTHPAQNKRTDCSPEIIIWLTIFVWILSEFLFKTKTYICQWGKKNNFVSTLN